MSFAIDVQALRERADARLMANAANAANSVEPISQLATLAVSHVCKAVRKGGNPLLTAEQGNACHAPCWSDAEIQVFANRRDRLLRWGYAEQVADDLAERLTLRDREDDDRRVCAECHHGRARRCPDGAPLPRDVLHRCAAFAEHAT